MNHIACAVVLSTFHIMPEQSFAFSLQSWNWTNYLKFKRLLLYQMSYLRTYQDVLLLLLHTLLGYKIQHTSCLLPCELLNHTSRIRSSLLRLYCYIAFPCEVRLCNYPLVFQHSRVWFDTARPPQSIRTHRPALFVSFRTYITHLLPTAILLTGIAYGDGRDNPYLGLYRWTIAGAVT